MSTTAGLLAGLMAEAGFAGSLGTALAADDAALRAAVAGLIGEGRGAEAHRLCAARLAEAPRDGNWHMLSARALAAMGRIEAAIEALARVRDAGLPCTRLLEEMIALSIQATKLYEGAMAAGAYERALALCECLVTHCPGIEAFERGRAVARHALRRQRAEAAVQAAHPGQSARLSWSHLEGLERAASACQHRQETARELQLRMEIWRHPLQPHQHGAFRLRNLAAALARLLDAGISAFPPERLALAGELLAAAAAVIPGLPGDAAWADDALGRWGRHHQLLLATIDLGRVFGPPGLATPPLPTSFCTAAGVPLSRPELAARAAEVVFFTAASPAYFARYGRNYVSSVLRACDRPCLVVVCLCAPRAQLVGFAASLGIDDPRLVFCSDDFDARRHSVSVVVPFQSETSPVPAAYYASAALLRTEILLDWLARPVIVSGIDTVLQRGVADLLDRYAGCDVVLNRLRDPALLGSQIINNLVLFNPTGNAALFARFLKQYLGGHLMQPVQALFNDQLDLHLARHHLMARGHAPSVAEFDPLDINNAMFNRDNCSQHGERIRGFRFLNMFVSAFADNKLTPEDIDAIAPAPA